MTQISFILHCIPPKTTHQSSSRIFKNPKTGRMFVGKNKKGAETKNTLVQLLIPHTPEKPLEGALKCVIRWVYPWRKSETKKNRAKGAMWCPTRSDCDNLMKMFGDCLTRLGFWQDDSQVAILHFEKLYSDNPRIEVDIEELE